MFFLGGLQAAAAETTVASVSGKISVPADITTGGMRVEVYETNSPDFYVQSVPVGSDGSYSIGGLSADSYKLRFSASGTGALDSWYNNAATFDSATTVTLTAGQNLTGINATLVKGATISGKVTAPAGVSLTGARVEAYGSDASSYVQSASISSDGTYKILSLPGGSYKLKFTGYNTGALDQWHSNATSFQTATAVSLAAGQDLSGVDATLVKGATISGKVTAPLGIAVNGVRVELYKADSANSYVSSAYVGSDGSYKFTGLQAASYKVKFAGNGTGALAQWHSNAVSFDTATTLTLTTGQDLAGIDATLVKGATVSGKITAPAGVILGNTSAYIYKAGDQYSPVTYTYPGTDGSYKLIGLPAGSYKLKFAANNSGALDQWHNNAASFDTATALTLTTGQDLADVNATLVKGATISGKITAPAGVNLNGAYVYAFSANDAGTSVEQAWVASDGSYKIIGLPAGNYKLNFSGYNTGALDQWHSNAASFDTATPLTLTTGQDLVGINATLVKGATISGKITAPAGVTLNNTYVYAYNASYSSYQEKSVSVSSDGSYKIIGLRAGSYKLKISGYNTGALDQWHSNAASFDTATPLALTTGQDLAGIDATLVKGATISGKMTAPAGVDLTDIRATLYKTNDAYSSVATTYASQDGTYRFTGLPAGSYKLKFTGYGTGTLDQWHLRSTSFDTATIITLTTGQDVSGIDATLVKGATISGKITAPAGVTLEKTGVMVYKTDNSYSSVASANVGSDGSYKILGLPAGSYKLKFTGNSSGALDQWHSTAASFETATALTLTTGQDVAGINAALAKGATISGKITPPAGVGLGSTFVYIYKTDDRYSYVASTYPGADGSYKITGLPAGSYKVMFSGYDSKTLEQWYSNATSFDTATAVTLTAGQDVTGINASLVKSATISGKITAPTGVDLGKARVYAYGTDNPDSTVGYATVGSDGTYMINRLPAGSYKLQFTGNNTGALEQWYNNAASFADATAVTVTTGQDVTGVNAALIKGATISGKVTAPAAVNLTNTRAELYKTDSATYPVKSAYLGSDGTWRFTGLPAGSYKLKFTGTDTGALDQWHNNAPSFETASTLILTTGQDLTGITTTLVKGATISGKIAAPAGVSLATIKAYAYKADDESAQVASSSLTSTGSYQIIGLPAGSYKLKFIGDKSGALEKWYTNAASFATATAVTVTTGQDLIGVDAVLVKSATVSGKVTVPAGVTVASVRVEIYKTDYAYSPVGTASVGSDGTYKVIGLPAGSYKLKFAGAKAGALDLWHSNAASFDTATIVTLTNGQDLTGLNATLVKGATISGKVTAPAGVSLIRSSVYVYNAAEGGNYVQYASLGSDGSYKFIGLPAGNYKLSFSGYNSGAQELWYKTGTSFSTATALTVAAGQDLTGIDVLLVKGATISGKVTTPVGIAANSTRVALYKADSSSSSLQSVWVGPDGSYKFSELTAGSYKIKFLGNGSGALDQWHSNAASFDTATPLTLTTGQDLAGISTTLLKGATISGKVSTATGVSVSNANIYAYKADDATASVASARVNTDGSYKIIGLPTGTYKVKLQGNGSGATDQWYGGATFETASPVALTAGSDKTAVDFTAQLGGSIAGKVSGAQQGYAPVTVLDLTGKPVKEGYSDKTGNYSVVGLANGSYKVAFNRSSGYSTEEAQYYQNKPESAGIGQASTLSVPTGTSVTNIDATLTPGGVLSGSVTDNAGKPLANVPVYAYTINSSLVTRSSWTDATGKYSIPGLTTGQYIVKASTGKPELGDLYSGNTTSEATATPIATAAGTTSTLNLSFASLTLDPAPVPTITGTAKVGLTLTAVPGTWGPAPVTLTYGWKANGVTIIGATASTYKPVAANYGKTITVTVTGTKSGYTTTAKTSAATATVAAGTLTSPVPTITGTVKVGSTLTAVPGTWGPGAVTLRYQWKANGTAITGATATTYTPVTADLGKTITVTVTGSKTGYTTVAKTSAASTAVAPGTLTAPTPTITGTVKEGSTLTAVPGTWEPAPVDLAYQWNANGTAITGATATTYTPAAADVGKTITVTVTGTKTGYTTDMKTSEPAGTVMALDPTLTSPVPTITGTAKVGLTLTAVPGTWGPAPVTLTYGWKANGVTIIGATASTYKPVAANYGKTITVTVTGTKSGYTTTAKTSAATATVAAGTLTSPVPTITGTVKVGSTLTAVPGTWGPGAVTLRYQWKANGTAITGATATTYTPVTADLGKTITVTVTGSKTGYTTVAKTSAASTAVAPGTLTAPTPTITGTVKEGSTLTAVPGTWEPAPVDLAYQWNANGTAITGATATTYTPAAADVGKTITVTVTGTKTGYTTDMKTSEPAGTVMALNPTLTSPVPTITGTAKVGLTLTAVPGTWGPAPVTLTYGWKANGVTIIGATASTYKPVAANYGKTITVTVTGTKSGYTTTAKTSAATATVAAGTLTSPVPTITGTVKVGSTLTAVPGTWGPGAVTLRYQWKANGTAITGATATTYTPVTADLGKTITVTVTGSKTGYTTVAKTSAASTAVAP
ncbi:carboxypeptidase regulatory-like domain-containing protein [Arthrobacter pascens]|uniref:carboxypeptidase regulatory-like domain-containing protein n=1 Tax=Arthrobacter pascens TaxID=1677 RepID=UPI0027D86B3C|nr:carboxypeptidase regulatory-like domain-containing protein [Arthrobacter pascens]